MRVEDATFALRVCNRILDLLPHDAAPAAHKAERKALIDAAVFDRLSEVIRKYTGRPEIQYKACLVIAALAKAADAKEVARVQKKAANIFHAMHAAVDSVMEPAREALRTLTCNHRENTAMAMRSGFKEDWLDPDSNVPV